MKRSSPHRRAGLTRTALLSVCAGAGVLATLGVLLTRDGGTRAADSGRGAPSALAPVEASGAEAPAADPLVPAVVLADQATPPAPAEPQVAADVAPPAEDAGALAATAADGKVEGPALRRVKNEGKPETFAKGELRAEFREQRREQRAREAEHAKATGETRTSPATKVAPDDERRARIDRRKRRATPGGG